MEALQKIDMNELTEQEQKDVQNLLQTIDITDMQSVLQYGADAQAEIAEFSDALLAEVRTKDTGHIGDSLTSLMAEIKGIDVDSLSDNGFLDRLFGGFKSKVTKFISSYEKVNLNIDHITKELESEKAILFNDISMLDNLYQKNIGFINKLDDYIMAGALKIKEMNDVTLPKLKADADAAEDALAAQKYNDTQQLIERFEKKIHDLELSRMVAIQSAPQIRLIQNNNNVLVEKIQSSILNTIPLWKNQIIIAISLFRQEKALKLQEEVTNMTNELLTKNSEMLKDQSVRVAKANERGIVDIETLQKVHSDLISTIEETLKIQQEGKLKRSEAKRELDHLEQDLKRQLTSARDKQTLSKTEAYQ